MKQLVLVDGLGSQCDSAGMSRAEYRHVTSAILYPVLNISMPQWLAMCRRTIAFGLLSSALASKPSSCLSYHLYVTVPCCMLTKLVFGFADKLEAAIKAMVSEVAQALEKAQSRLTVRVSETFAVLW